MTDPTKYEIWQRTWKRISYYVGEVVRFSVLASILLMRSHCPAPGSVVVEAVVAEPVWAVDMSGNAGGSIIPDAPITGQKRPPCRPDAEHLLNGGCWVGTDRNPPCPAGFYASGRLCFIPVLQRQKVPTSISQ